jgi:hypothetical protein
MKLEAGAKVGRLSLVERQRIGGRAVWNCACDCGTVKTVREDALKDGRTFSCGCLNAELSADRSTSHGGSRSRAYRSWRTMLNRCYRPEHSGFRYYGGRGIAVCERWKNFASFRDDMGEPGAGMQLDRINTDGDYAPGNCRWVTPKQNANNRRNTTFVEFDGKKKTVSEWADATGIPRATIATRLWHGWSPERTLTTTEYKRGNKRETFGSL